MLNYYWNRVSVRAWLPVTDESLPQLPVYRDPNMVTSISELDKMGKATMQLHEKGSQNNNRWIRPPLVNSLSRPKHCQASALKKKTTDIAFKSKKQTVPHTLSAKQVLTGCGQLVCSEAEMSMLHKNPLHPSLEKLYQKASFDLLSMNDPHCSYDTHHALSFLFSKCGAQVLFMTSIIN